MAYWLWNIFFGLIGMAYLSYGRSQKVIYPMLCGLGLMVFPYFVSSYWLMLPMGAALIAVPWIWREW
jgi:hypothetical protein